MKKITQAQEIQALKDRVAALTNAYNDLAMKFQDHGHVMRTPYGDVYPPGHGRTNVKII